MNKGNVNLGINLNRSSAVRVAVNFFQKNKRITTLSISAYNCKLIFEYKGSRKREDIKAGLVFIRGFKINNQKEFIGKIEW